MSRACRTHLAQIFQALALHKINVKQMINWVERNVCVGETRLEGDQTPVTPWEFGAGSTTGITRVIGEGGKQWFGSRWIQA